MCLTGVEGASATVARGRSVVVSEESEEEGIAGSGDDDDVVIKTWSLFGAVAAVEARGSIGCLMLGIGMISDVMVE